MATRRLAVNAILLFSGVVSSREAFWRVRAEARDRFYRKKLREFGNYTYFWRVLSLKKSSLYSVDIDTKKPATVITCNCWNARVYWCVEKESEAVCAWGDAAFGDIGRDERWLVHSLGAELFIGRLRTNFGGCLGTHCEKEELLAREIYATIFCNSEYNYALN